MELNSSASLVVEIVPDPNDLRNQAAAIKMEREGNKRAAAKPSKKRLLWRCPECGERFITANMWHSCGKHTLEELFARSEPHVLPLFRKFAKMVRSCGPVRMIPQKTRVVFQVRVRFAGAYPRKSYFLCGIALPRRVDDARFVRSKPTHRTFKDTSSA